MNDLDESYLENIRDALIKLSDRTKKLYESEGQDPSESSKANTEYQNAERPESILTAMNISSALIEYSAEHIAAFINTIEEPILPLACWTCVRSMLESCAISIWLSDPEIDARERIARTFAIRYEGMIQQLKFGRCITQPAEEINSLLARIDDVENIATNLGYSSIRDRNGNRISIGRPMPNATELIRDNLDEEWMYRLLSAVAHGHNWALLNLGYKRVNQQNTQSEMSSMGGVAFEKNLKPEAIATLGLCATKSFTKALWNRSLFMGWDEQKLKVVLEDVFDILKANADIRFWRQPELRR